MHQRFTIVSLVLLMFSLPATGEELPAPQTQVPAGQLVEGAQQRRESQPEQEGGQAQQTVKEARVELERAAIGLEQADRAGLPNALQDARASLDQFEEGLEQIRQSLSGQISLGLAESLARQLERTRLLLDSDAQTAALSMHELSLRVTDLTAEADLLIGKALVGSDGKWVGDVSNVLITSNGRIRAIVIEQGGGLGSGERQVALEWAEIGISGTQLTVNMTADQVFKLPGYVAE